MRGCSGRSAMRGGREEGEDTEGLLDCAAFWKDLGRWRGGYGGPIAFVGGRRACIGWLVRMWELLAVTDLERVGRCGGRIHLWLRSWGSLVVTELLVISDGEAGNGALWRSWDSSAGAELGIFGGD